MALNDTLGFGQSAVKGPAKSASFKIKNIGAGDLKGNVPAPSSPFAVILGNGAFDLASGQTKGVTVTFAPTAAIHFSQPLTILVTAPGKPMAGITIRLSGRGI